MSSEAEKASLTQAQQERIEKNRKKALQLKKSRLVAHPYNKTEIVSFDKNTIKVGHTKYKDTGGGFLLEEETDKPEEEPPVIKEPLASLAPGDRPTCEKCKETFSNSWLFDTFDCKVCDTCKDPEIHTLITKTEAMKEYLLKDCDLERREPPLKFITRKNPHNVNWGEMKLYLQIQIEDRALEVWGSEENLEKEMELREEKKLQSKTKKYQKQMKALRMNIRSSLFDRTSSASHTHIFGPETYNEEDDSYTHTCTSCKYTETFEKM